MALTACVGSWQGWRLVPLICPAEIYRLVRYRHHYARNLGLGKELYLVVAVRLENVLVSLAAVTLRLHLNNLPVSEMNVENFHGVTEQPNK